MKTPWMFVTALLVCVGCQDRNEPQKTAGSQTSPPAAAVSPESPAEKELAPDTVLAEVNGRKLLYADAQEQLELRLRAAGDRLPPDRLPLIRRQMLRGIVEQFVLRSLLLQEADARKIEVTPEDEQKAYARIQESLPPGMTVDDVLKTSPVGEKKMREEVTVGIRIDKLLNTLYPEDQAPSEAEVTAFMEENKENLAVPERVKARHILVAFAEGDNDAAKQEKKTKIETVRKRLLEGADFEAEARENSDCPSRQQGGDLGTFPRGRMVPAFEDAAFSQEVGAIGPVVETSFGYHIIQVTDHQKEGTATRDEVTRLLKSQKRQQALRGVIDELKSKAQITYAAGFEPAEK